MPCPQPAALFGLLKNPGRLRILTALSGVTEACVGTISDATGLSQPTVSRHLKHLERAGLVRMRKAGPYHHFSIDVEKARPFLSCLVPSPVSPPLEPTELMYIWHVETGEQQWYGDVDKAFGYPPGEFPRTVDAWEERIHPEDYDRVMNAAYGHMEAGKPFKETYRVRKADGTYVTWKDCGSALLEGGSPKWIGLVREVPSEPLPQNASFAVTMAAMAAETMADRV